MITHIVYVSTQDAINPEYERIFSRDGDAERIQFFYVSQKSFRDCPEIVYKGLSETVHKGEVWKLILVDDSRRVCQKRKESCLTSCEGGGRNHYRDYEFREQIQVLAGERSHKDYTGGTPVAFFILLTRGDHQECRYKLLNEKNRDAVSFLLSEGLPFHARYLVYDFSEKAEISLFFLVWALAQDAVAMDYLHSGRIYKISAEWKMEGLWRYLNETRDEMNSRKNKAVELNLSGTGERERFSERIGTINWVEKAAVSPLDEKVSWRALGRLFKSILRKLGEEQQRIQREGTESFRQIRQTEPKKGRGGTAEHEEYETVLLNHFRVGNADFCGVETEIKEFLQEHGRIKKGIRPWIEGIVGFMAAFFVISICLCILNDLIDSISFLTVFKEMVGMVGVLIGFVLLDCVYVAGRYLDMCQRFQELEQKADGLLDSHIKRINKQFDAMVAYQSYVYYKREALQAMKTDLEKHKKGRADEKELELEEALWNSLKKIAGEEISDLHYHRGQEHTCAILGQEIRCPYYFLEEISIIPEIDAKRDNSC